MWRLKVQIERDEPEIVEQLKGGDVIAVFNHAIMVVNPPYSCILEEYNEAKKRYVALRLFKKYR